MAEKQIILINPCKKIEYFDILTRDIHQHGEDYSASEGNIKLNINEVFDFISQGGDWNWKVVEHNNVENVFMSGSSYKSMQDAAKGEEHLSLGWLEEHEIEELHETIYQKMRVKYSI